MTTTYAHNIRNVLISATPAEVIEGMHWYDETRAFANDISNGDIWKGAGVIAAYSPMTPWWRNKELAANTFKTGKADPKSIKMNVNKAQRILKGEDVLTVLNGPKLKAFASAIADPNTELVTVDQHSYSVAMGRHHTTRNAKFGIRVYRAIAEAYREVADQTPYTAIQVQAITWVAWRNRNWHGTARKGESRLDA